MPSGAIVRDRYEFMVYRQLRDGLEAGDLHCRDSARFRSFEDDLVDDATFDRRAELSRGFRDAYIAETGVLKHGHGPTGEHSHGGVAFTTWLDLDQAAQQARAVASARARKRPHEKAGIDRTLMMLEADLLALDQRMAEIVDSDPARPLLASHPVYQYLARRYGLNLKSLMWEPDEVPIERHWSDLEQIVRGHRATWMLWEGPPAQQSVERLRALGIESIVLSPCANQPETGDLLSVLSNNAESLERVFQ